ncbi:MAG: IclR family transcriptional regulator [Pseudomonadota bacterium]
MREASGSIARAAAVLDAVSARSGDGGATLAQLAAGTAFSKTTTHRVLGALARVEYVHQDPETRAWRLGQRLASLSRTAGHGDLAGLARRPMRRLAEVTGDTVFLSVPEGPASVCIARETGSYPIRTLTLEPGARRPLGVGAGALALYCAMPEAARRAANRVNRAWLEEYGVDVARLETARARTAADGVALNDGMVLPEMAAVGLAVPGAGGRPRAALAVGAIATRMTRERLEAVVLPALRKAAERLEARLVAEAEAGAAA